MPPREPATIFPLFVIAWIVLGSGITAFFYLNRNAALKRRLLPFIMIATGALFVAMTSWMQGGIVWPWVAFIAVIVWINIRTIRFCDACGRTIFRRMAFVPPKFCDGRGAPLK